MPYYAWKDKNSDYNFDVLRDHDDYETSPQEDELPKEEQGKDRDWERFIAKAPTVIKGPSWGGGKGNW